jgi:DNA-binding transcriptional LysR family regulator
MDRLRCLHVFTEVARSQSFVRAALRLSISKATVTKHVAWLENSMGSQLLNRNSKHVTLTDAGLRVLESGQVGASLTKASMTARRERMGARPLQAHGALLPIANRGGRAVSPREKRTAVDSCV